MSQPEIHVRRALATCIYMLAALGLPSCSTHKPAARQAGPAQVTTAATLPARVTQFPAVAQGAPPNAHRVTDKVIAGAQPEGDSGFKALHDLGVKTVISVDGAVPDVEGARRHGIRYVHLPIEYSGVTQQQGIAIAKAIEELPGPIYLHCHHGKHRAAAAVAVACVYNGSLPPEDAEKVLETLGTGENYKGLWRAAREARPLAPGLLKEAEVTYPPISKIGSLAEAMVKIDQRMDDLKAARKAGWQAPADHPDIAPVHEALMLEELLREVARGAEPGTRPAAFGRMLGDGVASAAAVRAALASKPVDPAKADAAIKLLGTSCTQCHRTYRD